MTFASDAVLAALRASWSSESASRWTAHNPAKGQCNVTALLIHELYGGEILKTVLPDSNHFYNRIDGVRVDLTASQFAQPIEYVDILSERDDAACGATDARLQALRFTLAVNLGSSGQDRGRYWRIRR